MHAALGQFSTAQEVDFVSAEALVAGTSSPASCQPVPWQPGSYRAPRLRGWALAAVVVAHAVLLAFVVTLKMAPVVRPKPVPLVVNAIQLPAEPPPEKVALPEPVPVKVVQPQIFAPAPIVPVVQAPTQIQTVAVAPAPAPVVETPAPAPAPETVRVPDLLTRAIYAPKPKYPIESNRKREEGTVVLYVEVGLSGTVEQVSIRKSSGFTRLDKAAIDSIRRWRWSPEIRNGRPVTAAGIISVPFNLT